MSADPPARDRPAAVGRPGVLRRLATTGRSAGAAAARAASVTVLAVVWLRDKELPAAVRPWTTAESWTGKALIAVSLTCVANANPALHQFIESLMSIGSKP